MYFFVIIEQEINKASSALIYVTFNYSLSCYLTGWRNWFGIESLSDKKISVTYLKHKLNECSRYLCLTANFLQTPVFLDFRVFLHQVWPPGGRRHLFVPNCDDRSRNTPGKTPGIQWAHSTTRTAPCGSGRGSWAPPQVPPGGQSSTQRRHGSRGSREHWGRRSRPPPDPEGARKSDRRGTLAAAASNSLRKGGKKQVI